MSANDLQSLTSLFLAQVGTREQGENNVIYNTDFYGGPVGGPDFPWCCAFVWDVFRMAGLSELFCGGQKTAYCPFVASWAQSHDRWVTQGYRPGDVILYDFDGDRIADHIGFCVGVAGTSLTVIEGNVANAVQRMTRSAVGVMGAYRPAYASEQEPAAPAPPQPSSGRTYVVQPYDSLWKIARDELGDENRWPEIFDLNNLASTTIHPGDVLRLPDALPERPRDEDLPFALPSVCVSLPELRRGTSGRDVQALQLLLQRAGYTFPDYGIDGDFGEETEMALKHFQETMGLEVTGKASALTWFTLIC